MINASRRNYEHLSHFENFLEILGFKAYRIMRISSDELSKGRLLLIAGKSFEKYTTDERNIIIRHIQAGHRLLAFVDGDSVPFFDSLHEILQHAGIYVCPTKVRSNEDNHYIVTRNINKSHAITMGVNEKITNLNNAIAVFLSSLFEINNNRIVTKRISKKMMHDHMCENIPSNNNMKNKYLSFLLPSTFINLAKKTIAYNRKVHPTILHNISRNNL